jgi:hypothetical protein
VTCSITVSNAGPTAAQAVTVSDDLPAGATLVGTPSGGGFVCSSGDPFTCTLPSMAANTSATITVSVRLPADAAPGTSVTNQAMVSSATPDPGPSPNVATAATAFVTCTITGAGDIAGTPGHDVICGSAGPDRINGNGGNDTIFGFGGDDQISGGEGNDVVHGGTGNDRLTGGNERPALRRRRRRRPADGRRRRRLVPTTSRLAGSMSPGTPVPATATPWPSARGSRRAPAMPSS